MTTDCPKAAALPKTAYTLRELREDAPPGLYSYYDGSSKAFYVLKIDHDGCVRFFNVQDGKIESPCNVPCTVIYRPVYDDHPHPAILDILRLSSSHGPRPPEKDPRHFCVRAFGGLRSIPHGWYAVLTKTNPPQKSCSYLLVGPHHVRSLWSSAQSWNQSDNKNLGVVLSPPFVKDQGLNYPLHLYQITTDTDPLSLDCVIPYGLSNLTCTIVK